MKLTSIKIEASGNVSVRLIPETSVDKNLLELLRTGDYQPDGMHYDRGDSGFGGIASNREREIKALVVYLSADGSEE